MNVTHLECGLCGLKHEARRLLNLCTECGKPLLVRYDLEQAARSLTKESLRGRRADLWRYSEVLPVDADENIVSLGEGWTPLLHTKRLGEQLGFRELYIKDESQNPTQSFKARGMAAAVSMGKELGAQKLAVPSAGNAAGALAAYAACAGLEAFIFMPNDTPRANVIECEQTGAHVTLMDGLITDCGAEVARRKDAEGWFDVSTLKEPYRVEGKKTMGYELVEQLGWEYPDAVFYPTGGGVGLIGMWKAFEEMEQLGWVRPGKRPKMIAVQSSGCAPVARAFEQGAKVSQMWQNAATFAAGLRVPKPYGDSIMLEILRESGGVALAVSDQQILASLVDWARHEGIFLSPEGAAATASYDHLLATGFLKPEDRVVLFNTGGGLKYTDVTAEAMGLQRPAPPAWSRILPWSLAKPLSTFMMQSAHYRRRKSISAI